MAGSWPRRLARDLRMGGKGRVWRGVGAWVLLFASWARMRSRGRRNEGNGGTVLFWHQRSIVLGSIMSYQFDGTTTSASADSTGIKGGYLATTECLFSRALRTD